MPAEITLRRRHRGEKWILSLLWIDEILHAGAKVEHVGVAFVLISCLTMMRRPALHFVSKTATSFGLKLNILASK